MDFKIKFKDDEEEFRFDSFEDILKLDNYNDIIYLCCRSDNLTSLPTLPSSLIQLSCTRNKLTSLPTLPFSLIQLYCSGNPINSYINNYFGKDWVKYRKFQHFTLKKSANKIGNWFLECKYNPGYKYCQRRLVKEYKELFREV